MRKISTLLFFVAIALVGCKNADPVQTVDWYKANAPERAKMRAKCQSNPGELAATPNCINANRAESVVNSEKRGGLNIQPMTNIKLGQIK